MNTSVIRSYAQEIALARAVGFYRNLIVAVCTILIAFALVLDLVDMRHNVFFLRSLLTLIVAGGFVVSILRYTRHIVDEARAGPDYLLARRGKTTVLITLEEIASVRLDAFVPYLQLISKWGYLERVEIRLKRPGRLGTVIAFCPPLGWEDTWPQRSVTQALLNISVR